VDIEKIKELLLASWSAETAVGEWSQDNPSLGQCAVTALVVQDFLGGELLRCKTTDGGSHYWNRLPDATEIDLTESQFDYIDSKPLKNDVLVRTRDYVLSFEPTSLRYKILKNKVIENMTK